MNRKSISKGQWPSPALTNAQNGKTFYSEIQANGPALETAPLPSQYVRTQEYHNQWNDWMMGSVDVSFATEQHGASAWSLHQTTSVPFHGQTGATTGPGPAFETCQPRWES